MGISCEQLLIQFYADFVEISQVFGHGSKCACGYDIIRKYFSQVVFSRFSGIATIKGNR